MPASADELANMMLASLPTASVAAASQVIHSDLAGNVLFADELGLPPAVIDVSPQFRPVGYADAILVADAVAWHGAPLSFASAFLERASDHVGNLARAVIFRVTTAALHRDVAPARVVDEANRYRRLLPALTRA